MSRSVPGQNVYLRPARRAETPESTINATSAPRTSPLRQQAIRKVKSLGFKRSGADQGLCFFRAMTMNDHEAASQLNCVKHLSLLQLFEPRNNALRLIVEEAVLPRSSMVLEMGAMPELEHILSDTMLLGSIKGGRRFELAWERYVAYLVTPGETPGSRSKYDDEIYSGTSFRNYQKSHFLDHILRDRGDLSEPIRHYRIVCLHHVIDVAAYSLPDVQVLSEQAFERRFSEK